MQKIQNDIQYIKINKHIYKNKKDKNWEYRISQISIFRWASALHCSSEQLYFWIHIWVTSL